MPDRKKRSQQETCGYVAVNGRKVHYRRCGDGPAMLLLHASPLSSTSLRPAMEVFGEHFCCIALDTPGFGLSDPLPENRDDIFAYADALKDTIEALGLEKPIVYGASTGAAITHALGCKYPELAGLLMLDTFSHHEADDIVEGYFLDMVPQSNGAQFLSVWEKAQGLFLFSPWQRSDAERRQVRTLPRAEMVHDMAMQLLAAGKGYHHVYKSAIDWEHKDKVGLLKAPATINLWQGGSNTERVQILIEMGLPENYTLIESGIGPQSRYLNQHAYLLENDFHLRRAACLEEVELKSEAQRRYIDTDFGQLHTFFAGGRDAAPLLLLHDWGASASQLTKLIAALAMHRQTIAPDLPSHGASPATTHDFAEMLSALEDFVLALDLRELDIVGVGNAATLAQGLRDALPDRIGKIAYFASGPILDLGNSAEFRREFVKRMRPHVSGSQFIAAHGLAKQKRLFWDWTNAEKSQAISRPDALDRWALHISAIDSLRMRVDEAKLLAGQCAITAKEMLVFAPEWEIGGEPLTATLGESYRNVKRISGQEDDWAEAIIEALEASAQTPKKTSAA